MSNHNSIVNELSGIKQKYSKEGSEEFAKALVSFITNSNDDEIFLQVLNSIGVIATAKINRANYNARFSRQMAINVGSRVSEISPKSRPNSVLAYATMTAALFVEEDKPYSGPRCVREHEMLNDLIVLVKTCKTPEERDKSLKYIKSINKSLGDYVDSKSIINKAE